MNIILSIIIVEYYNIQEVGDCIVSIKNHISVPYEIIVSSNSCYDQHQKEKINLNEESVKWIFNRQNEGFARAMNNGLNIAKGKYMIIMNSDCIIETNLNELISFMDSHPEVGAIAPKMIDKQGKIQDTARPYVTLQGFVWRQIKRIVGHKTSILNTHMDYNKTQTVDWVIGAFMMVSRNAYNITGGLDDKYFMYAEDLDWCTRIRLQGYEIVYAPQIIIIYKGTRRARTNLKYAKIFLSSHIRYWKKFGFFYGYPARKHITYNTN